VDACHVRVVAMKRSQGRIVKLQCLIKVFRVDNILENRRVVLPCSQIVRCPRPDLQKRNRVPRYPAVRPANLLRQNGIHRLWAFCVPGASPAGASGRWRSSRSRFAAPNDGRRDGYADLWLPVSAPGSKLLRASRSAWNDCDRDPNRFAVEFLPAEAGSP
jgi:hypothetical protein